MQNKLFNLDKEHVRFTGHFLLPTKEEPCGRYGSDIHHFSINPDVIKLLEVTEIPKKAIYLKYPFDLIHISNRLVFKNYELPYGIFLWYNKDHLEGDEREFDNIQNCAVQRGEYTTNEEDTLIKLGDVSFFVGFYYISTKDMEEGFFSYNHWNIFSDNIKEAFEFSNYNEDTEYMDEEDFEEYDSRVWDEAGRGNYTEVKKYPLKEVNEFVYKLLLFINCPDVELKHTEGRAKQFRKEKYDFFQPKKLYCELSHDLRKYIQTIKRQYGVQFKFHYQYMVRGHFRNLTNSKYKVSKVIWIKPYFKGSGSYIPKEKIVCRNL